ncbi:MAG: hypothetical protein ABIZ81_18215 [Opitutaceae bacterium]
MNDLAARKQAILAQADLHRQVFALERMQLEERWAAAHVLAGRSRWWLVGGGVVASLLFKPGWRNLMGLAPTLWSAWRAFRR